MRHTFSVLLLLLTLTACVGTPAPSSTSSNSSPSQTPTPTLSSTPSQQPTKPPTTDPAPEPPAESPDDASTSPAPETVSGFDAKIAWDACVAAGQQKYPFDVIYDYESGLTTPSITSLDPNGGPSVDVTVKYRGTYQATTFDSIWICQMFGDPAAPTIAVIDVPDK